VSLYDLALSACLRGGLSRAARLLKEGIAVAAQAKDRSAVAYCLEALAAVASDQGHPEGAICLLTGAAALLQASGSGWLHAYVPPPPQADHVLAPRRPRVGDAAYEQARKRGGSFDGTRALQQLIEQVQRAPARA